MPFTRDYPPLPPHDPDSAAVPLAHTCFFLIELPEYTDYAVCKRMLQLAITYGAGEAFLIA